MEEVLKQIEQAGATLSQLIEGLSSPLGERAKALVADATAAAVQAYATEYSHQHPAPVEEPPVDVPVEPVPQEPTHDPVVTTRRRR